MIRHRLLWLDTLKGWGILFIVLGHIVGAGCHLGTEVAQAFCVSAYKYFYAFHVPLFFFIAGLTFKHVDWKLFCLKKAKRLLLPYLIFGFLSIVVYAVMSSMINNTLTVESTTAYYENKTATISIGKQCLNLLLGGCWANGFVANSVLWFIPALIAVETVAQVFSRWLQSYWGWMMLGGGALLLWIFLGTKIPLLPFGFNLVPKYLPWLVLGYIFQKKSFNDSFQSISIFVLLAILLCVALLTIYNPYQYYSQTLVQHLLTITLTALNILLWLGIAVKRTSNVMIYCGGASLGIMLMHKFPVLFFQNVCAPIRELFTISLPLTLLGIILVLLLTMIACVMGIAVLRRYLPWVLGENKHKINGIRDEFKL